MKLTKDSESKSITCPSCGYTWESKSKRPNPRFISCPNCAVGVELRESKLN